MNVIASIGTYLPEPRHTAAHIAQCSGLPEWVVRDKLGIEEKVMPGEQDDSCAMGVRAANQALISAKVDAAEVDVLISITEEHKEYPVWTAGIYAAQQLGAHKAYAFDVGQKCGTAILALKLANDQLTADQRINTVLIAGGYRNSDLIDYRDPNVRFLYSLGAGGGAAVVKRDAPGFELLGSAFITDGRFSEDVIVPVGGTRQPLTRDNVGDYRLQVTDPADMKQRLEPLSLENFVKVVEQACERSNVKPHALSYCAVLHVKPSAHHALLQRLGLAKERSIYLSRYGHLGQVDPLLSLQLAQQEGRFANGDIAVLVAAGIGYVWNAMCLRYHA